MRPSNTYHCTVTETNYPVLAEIPKLEQNRLWVEAKSPTEISLLSHLPRRALGIVGSRAAQGKSRLLLERTLRALEGSNIVIISGLAKGIDAEAHRMALDFGLTTIGVLAHGFDLHYPNETAGLRKEIIEKGGLIVSEYSPTIEPKPYQFVHRNRIIAALSEAVWVVQAGKSSGALNTAKWALQLNRDLFTTPCFPGDVSLSGNEYLLQNPAVNPLWSAESLSSVWLDLFSQLRKPQMSLFH